jgi:uncharacterized membrane protein YhaH (DUF805 family)
MFVLFQIIFAIAAIVIDNVLGLAIKDIGYGPIYLLYALATFIPGLAVAIRRLHDTGKSGWYFLVAFIPLIGGIILLVFMVMQGDIGENAYGPDPKEYESVGLGI